MYHQATNCTTAGVQSCNFLLDDTMFVTPFLCECVIILCSSPHSCASCRSSQTTSITLLSCLQDPSLQCVELVFQVHCTLIFCCCHVTCCYRRSCVVLLSSANVRFRSDFESSKRHFSTHVTCLAGIPALSQSALEAIRGYQHFLPGFAGILPHLLCGCHVI